MDVEPVCDWHKGAFQGMLQQCVYGILKPKIEQWNDCQSHVQGIGQQ